jgi:hypothetical protein
MPYIAPACESIDRNNLKKNNYKLLVINMLTLQKRNG